MPENQNVEWKERWKDEYLEWICAFANTDGGKLLIGVDDNGKVVGVSGYEKLLRDIPNKICNVLGIVASVKLIEENGVPYIEISVPPYPVGISCRGVYYCRSGSTKQVLAGPALESFLLRRRGASWDNMPFPSFTIDDVDDREIQKFCKLAAEKGRIAPELLKEPKDVLLEKLHLTRSGYLTNAAMLLFSKDPQEWQQGAYIKIGYFESDSEVAYQDEIHGPLLEQVDSALDLIYFKYLKAKIFYKGIQRIERYFVPRDALREALINAVCHKRYESCIPIQVSVYDDRLYVANDGGLPEGWTAKKLMGKHDSKPYNPYVATVLYYAGFIESWGRGIEKICAACRMDGVYDPIYTVDPGDVMVEFTAPEERIVRIGASGAGASNFNVAAGRSREVPNLQNGKVTYEQNGKVIDQQNGKVVCDGTFSCGKTHYIDLISGNTKEIDDESVDAKTGLKVDQDGGLKSICNDISMVTCNAKKEVACNPVKEVAGAYSGKVADERDAAHVHRSHDVGGEPELSSSQVVARVKAPSRKSGNRLDDDEVLAALEKNPTSNIRDLAEVIGVSRKTLSLHLKLLIKQKRIKRYGTTQNGFWKLLAKENKT